MTDYIPIVLAILGSSGLFSLIQFLINRKDGKADALKRIEKTVENLRQDSIRTQLLLLISDYPDRRDKIFELAEEYFVTLGGNWYLSSIFNKWLEDQKLPKPDWYKH